MLHPHSITVGANCTKAACKALWHCLLNSSGQHHIRYPRKPALISVHTSSVHTGSVPSQSPRFSYPACFGKRTIWTRGTGWLTGRMSVLSPNQQCQSTEGNTKVLIPSSRLVLSFRHPPPDYFLRTDTWSMIAVHGREAAVFKWYTCPDSWAFSAAFHTEQTTYTRGWINSLLALPNVTTL